MNVDSLYTFPITFSDVFHIQVSTMNFFISAWQDQNVQVCCCTSEGQLQWHGHGYFFLGGRYVCFILGGSCLNSGFSNFAGRFSLRGKTG